MAGRLRRVRRGVLEQLEPRQMLSAGPLAALAPVAAKVANAAAVGDDFGNTIAAATPIAVSSAGDGSRSGTIETSGDVDMFSIVAPISGTMALTQSAASGSRLDSYLYIYDSAGTLLARNDDSGGSLNSRIELNVTAGTTYFVKAAAFGRSTGAYVVQTSMAAGAAADDFGNTIATASPIALAADGSGSQSGKIEKAGDVDMFSVSATVTGAMTVAQSAATGSRLDSYVYVYDANGNLLARNDDYGGSLNSQVQVNVTAGARYFVKAAAYSRSTGAYNLRISTAASTPTPPPPTPSPGGFQIDVTMTGFTAAQQQTVQNAVDRWEQIITGDLPDVSYRGQVIDDVQIAISAISIDGVGNTLGQASATAFRTGSDLPYLGFIQLDTADVASMQSNGSLLGVLEHEIAHVLGFGIIWTDRGLLTGASTSRPGFTGAQAVAEYNALFGTTATSVPVESGGGSGTRLSHWSESAFGSELMTGWYNSNRSNPISRITIASMADLGYTVNLAAADPYTRPSSVAAVSAAPSAVGPAVVYSSELATAGSAKSGGTARPRVVDRIMELESWLI